MTYKLFIANKNYSSWSMRPWVLMTALGIDFEEVLTPFEGAGRQAAFDHFSPTSKVPCLHHEKRIIWDSLSIIEYLAEDHTGVWPEERNARSWARSACAEIHSGFAALRDECSMNCSLRIELPMPSEALHKDIARLNVLWQGGLARFGGPWLAGDRFSAVDAFYAPVAIRCRTYGLELERQAAAYAERLLGHPAIATWIEQGRQEHWRDGPHEQDCVRDRRVLEDYRDPSSLEAG